MNEKNSPGSYKQILREIRPADSQALAEAQKHMDSLIKPLGSLGKLEDIAVRIAGMTGSIKNDVGKKCTVVMAADNGICEEGVASTPQDITLVQANNMTRGICGIGVLSKAAGSDVCVVDIGINSDYADDKIIHAKIRKGTGNFAKEQAMTLEETEQAIDTGIRIISELVEKGYKVIGTGEMGIGNTSSSSAVIMAMTGAKAEQAVGIGGGLTPEAHLKKKQVLTAALALHRPDPNDPLDVVSKVGGLDIAGLMGCFIGAAFYRVPIVVDGVISIAAALAASRLNGDIRDFMIASHISKEPAYIIAEQELSLRPMLDLGMRLGEGTGCPLAFGIIDAACAVMNNMATFEEISIDKNYRVDNRK
jgi:nicotinate-nucleotide--dimethylbenzimidazole phosphoribosyltransferase